MGARELGCEEPQKMHQNALIQERDCDGVGKWLDVMNLEKTTNRFCK